MLDIFIFYINKKNTDNQLINNLDQSILRAIESFINDETFNFFSEFVNNENYDINVSFTTLYGGGIDNYINTEEEFQEILNFTFEDDLEHHSNNVEKSYNLVINTRRYKKIKNKYPDEKACSICLVDYEDDDRIVCNLKCKHIFHKECLKTWGKRSNNCPICRAES